MNRRGNIKIICGKEKLLAEQSTQLPPALYKNKQKTLLLTESGRKSCLQIATSQVENTTTGWSAQNTTLWLLLIYVFTKGGD